jgi:hypothetical protein
MGTRIYQHIQNLFFSTSLGAVEKDAVVLPRQDASDGIREVGVPVDALN